MITKPSITDMVTLRRLVACGIALFSAVAILTGIYFELRYLIFGLLLACSVALVVAVRKNVILFVISFIIAYVNYSAAVLNLFPSYTGYDTLYACTPIAVLGLTIVLLFMATILLFLPNEVKEVPPEGWPARFGNVRYSTALVLAIAVVLVVIFFTCSSGFTVNSYGRTSANSVFEYSYVLFIFGFLIAGDNRSLRGVLVAVALLYLAQIFLGGNRASGLTILLIFFVLFFSNKFTWVKVLPWLLFGFLLMVTMGYFRYSGDFILFRVVDALEQLFESSGVWDTATYAYHQCLAFLKLDEVITDSEKVRLTGNWIASWFVGGSAVPDATLSLYCQKLYPGMGGGLLPVYFYFYLGLPGVIASGALVAWFFKQITLMGELKSNLLFCLSASVAATVCRWYIYSPSPLTSALVFTSVVYLVLSLFLEKEDRVLRVRGSSLTLRGKPRD